LASTSNPGPLGGTVAHIQWNQYHGDPKTEKRNDAFLTDVVHLAHMGKLASVASRVNHMTGISGPHLKYMKNNAFKS
jgi:hypothetical protein